MPCIYIEGNVPKLSVRDVLRNIPRFSCDQKYVVEREIRTANLLILRRISYHYIISDIFQKSRSSEMESAVNLPDRSRNLSSYITECGNSEKFEVLLGSHQQIERRRFFRNICYTIFMI
jgi:hypothetical protein